MTQDAAHKGFCWTSPLYRPSHLFEQFRTQRFLRIESTEFALGSKIVGENRGEMANSLMTQDSTHRGFCRILPLYMYVWIDLHVLIMNNFEHRILRIEPYAVQRCASRRSTEFASR